MENYKKRGVGQLTEDGNFIFTAYKETGKKRIQKVAEQDNATLKETETHFLLTIKVPKQANTAERYEILRRCFSLVL